ncbi:MAG: hypothetical protein HRU12_17730, partial [Phaeodactylibacter sp.]|nr:hypothetical protein [Phaeodactylibacter sp.]
MKQLFLTLFLGFSLSIGYSQGLNTINPDSSFHWITNTVESWLNQKGDSVPASFRKAYSR